jgi:hypothetical protein
MVVPLPPSHFKSQLPWVTVVEDSHALWLVRIATSVQIPPKISPGELSVGERKSRRSQMWKKTKRAYLSCSVLWHWRQTPGAREALVQVAMHWDAVRPAAKQSNQLQFTSFVPSKNH